MVAGIRTPQPITRLEQDLPECDYYPMMDLVQMSADDDGRWLPDDDAIASVVDEYVITD